MIFHFILVEPSVPENIGASARAIKTMGFTQLRLVNPPLFPQEKMFHVAHASGEILINAKIFSSLKEALSGMDFSIATTAKRRSIRNDYHKADSLPDILQKKRRSVKHVAIVFGREERGLTNKEISYCDLISFIPMNRRYPSLNLSHAVMLYAYTISEFGTFKEKRSKAVGKGKFLRMKEMADDLMSEIHIRKNQNLYNRIIERLSLLNDNDINLVLSFLDRLSRSLPHQS